VLRALNILTNKGDVEEQSRLEDTGMHVDVVDDSVRELL
jgi:hypothetical protein